MPFMTNIPAIPDDQLEKYSSAISLSDMEIFVFPIIFNRQVTIGIFRWIVLTNKVQSFLLRKMLIYQ